MVDISHAIANTRILVTVCVCVCADWNLFECNWREYNVNMTLFYYSPPVAKEILSIFMIVEFITNPSDDNPSHTAINITIGWWVMENLKKKMTEQEMKKLNTDRETYMVNWIMDEYCWSILFKQFIITFWSLFCCYWCCC